MDKKDAIYRSITYKTAYGAEHIVDFPMKIIKDDEGNPVIIDAEGSSHHISEKVCFVTIKHMPGKGNREKYVWQQRPSV